MNPLELSSIIEGIFSPITFMKRENFWQNLILHDPIQNTKLNYIITIQAKKRMSRYKASYLLSDQGRKTFEIRSVTEIETGNFSLKTISKITCVKEAFFGIELKINEVYIYFSSRAHFFTFFRGVKF